MTHTLTTRTSNLYRVGNKGRWYRRRSAAYEAFARAAFNAKEPWEDCAGCIGRDSCNCHGGCAACGCRCWREQARRQKVIDRYARMLAARDARGGSR